MQHQSNLYYVIFHHADLSYDYEHPTTPSTPKSTPKPTTKVQKKPPSNATFNSELDIETVDLPTPDHVKTTCSTGFVLAGVRLVGGLYSGSYRVIGRVKNMTACMDACCKEKECTVAFMERRTCYAMKCLDKALCKSTIAGSDSSVGYVIRDGWTLYKSAHDSITDAAILDGLHSSNVTIAKGKQSKNTKKINGTAPKLPELPTPDTSQGMDIGYCEKGTTLENHRLMGGMKAGVFNDHGEVEDMETCSEYCCRDKECHLAYMVDKSCYSVKCFNSELCKTFTAPNFFLNPVISFVSRTRNTTGMFFTVNGYSSKASECLVKIVLVVYSDFNNCL